MVNEGKVPFLLLHLLQRVLIIWLLISPPGVAFEDYCDNHQGHQGQELQEVAVITKKKWEKMNAQDLFQNFNIITWYSFPAFFLNSFT